MSRRWRLCGALLGGLVLLPLPVTAAHASVPHRTAVGSQALVPAVRPPAFDPREFTHPTVIDNRFLPFVPGTRFVLEGTVDGVAHRVVLVVTDLTKMVNGVRTVVLWDRDFVDGQLSEAELAFEAQDNAGAVWNLGEYPELFEGGVFAGAPDTWIAGIDRARAGIHMLAGPVVGTPSYVQGSSPTIDFLDVAQVSRTGQRACDGIRCYDNVLVVDESSPLDPAAGHQLKFYAPGVGNIRISPAGGVQPESLLLVSHTLLTAAQMRRVRIEVLAMDVRGHLTNDVYRRTAPVR